MIGINPYASKISYVVIPDTVFYEFIPVNEYDKPSPKTYCIHELKINECYEIMITNYAGLYRYRLGDVIKVLGFYHKEVYNYVGKETIILTIIGILLGLTKSLIWCQKKPLKNT